MLPERDRPAILARIRGPWVLKDADLAEQRLEQLACELERPWPDAAASLREGCRAPLIGRTRRRWRFCWRFGRDACWPRAEAR